jgi:phosphate transport system substrate-binding protein
MREAYWIGFTIYAFAPDSALIHGLTKTPMRRTIIAYTVLLAAGLLGTSASAEYQRRYIYTVGSTTVFPFAKAVGEKFAKSKKLQLPLLQSTGTGGGFKLFCEGANGETPDIVNASRAMKPKEREECRANGVNDILEVKIGYDGLVLAQSKNAPPLALSRKEARMALAKWIPEANGKLVLNPYKTWKAINPSLPGTPIEILGPSVASGTYDALVDLISESECKGRPWAPDGTAEPTPDLLKKCRSLREDGAYIEGRDNDEDHVSLLAESPTKVALFDYKLLAEDNSRIRAIPIEGVEPTHDTIASRIYPGSRPLFLYVKKAHFDLIPGLKDYVAEFTGESTWGEKGYLKALGLVVMPPEERAVYTAEVKAQGISPASAAAGKVSAKSHGPHGKPKTKRRK